MLKTNEVEPRHYRDAMAQFAGAVHVITTDGDAGRRGTTIIAACSVSDAPPTVLACLNLQNPRNEAFLRNGRFALNTLSARQKPIADAFSGAAGVPHPERFAVGTWDTLSTGSPTLADALAVFDCEIVDYKDHATHRVLFGRVTGLRLGDNLEALLYHQRAYNTLAGAVFPQEPR